MYIYKRSACRIAGSSAIMLENLRRDSFPRMPPMAAVLDVGDEVLTAEDDNHVGEEWRRVEGRWKRTVAETPEKRAARPFY